MRDLRYLRARLRQFGVEAERASRIAKAIAAFRSASPGETGAAGREYAAAGRTYGPKNALFQSVLELDQVLGVDPALFRRLLPFVTVNSRQGGVDPRTAPPALLAALAGAALPQVLALASRPYPNDIDRNDPRLLSGSEAPSGGGAFLVHAEVLLPRGGAIWRRPDAPASGSGHPAAWRRRRQAARRPRAGSTPARSRLAKSRPRSISTRSRPPGQDRAPPAPPVPSAPEATSACHSWAGVPRTAP